MNSADTPRHRIASPQWPAIALFIALGAIMPLLGLRIAWTLDENQVNAVTKTLPEGDFANIWAGGRLALESRVTDIFDLDRYRGWFIERFGPETGKREWSYPPTMLLAGVLLAVLPLLPAALVWIFGSAAGLGLVLRRLRIPWPTLLATLLSPGALVSVVYGQTGTAAAALFIGGLMLAGTSPIAAGVMIGLLTVKPQIGLLIPVCLIAGGHIRTFVVATVTGLLMLLSTGLLFGWNVFALYWTETHPMMVAFLEQPSPELTQVNEISLFLTLRALGASVTVAYAFQFAAVAVAASATWFLWRRPMVDPMDRALRVGLTGCLGLMATPYIHNYDMVVYSFAVALMFGRNGWRISPLILLCWIWPDFVNLLNKTTFPVTPVIVGVFIVYAFLALRRRDPNSVEVERPI